MATNRRLAGSNDWANTSYWTLGAAPVDTNDVYLEVGGDTITTNLNQTSINLNLLHFGPKSRYNVGAEGTPLIIDANNAGAGKVEIYGLHDYIYLQAGTDSGTYPVIIHNPANPSAKLVMTSSIVTTLHHFAGQLFLRGTVTGTTLNLHGGFSAMDYTNSAGFTTINVYGGDHVIQRTFTTLNIYGGRVTLDDANNGVTFGAINQYGGELVHINGNTGAYALKTGTYNKSRLSKSGLTIGNFTATAQARIINSKGIDVTASSTTYTGGNPDISTGGGGGGVI